MTLRSGRWLNAGPGCLITDDGVTIRTTGGTDLWQRTFYGFHVANAPALVIDTPGNFTMTVRAQFEYRHRFDQAGILLWIDEHNWFKSSIEYESAAHCRLGSVVTTRGYSDWATRDVDTVGHAWFRLSRRGPDFLLEARLDDIWEQLRIFHLSALGETTADIAGATAGDIAAGSTAVGVYAASPEAGTFEARFDQIQLTQSTWQPHGPGSA